MPIPSCLRRLQTGGHLPDSALSKKMRAQLRTLVDSAVLERQSNRRGAMLAVRDPQRFANWLARQYPDAELEFARLAGMPRARAAAAYRDTKHGATTHRQQILIARSPRPDAIARIDDIPWPIGELTRQYGIAACLVTSATRLTLPCPCALVENQEVLLHCERIIPDIRTILYSAGKLSNTHIKVLARSLSEGDILYHLPDYDPTGLSDYERLRKAFHDFAQKDAVGKQPLRAPALPRLFVPQNLEEFLTRYGNEKLLQKNRNRAAFEKLSKSTLATHEARLVFEAIHRHGKALEQETLLLANHGKTDAVHFHES